MQITANVNIEAVNPFNLELFFELSADLICIAGYDGYFKRINPTVSKTLGYTNEELFSRPINEFVYKDDQIITASNRENLKRNSPLLNFENRYVTKAGEIVWLSWTSMPVESEQVVFAIAKNVTYKKKQDEDRNAHLEDLTRINHELKQLTYTTSHDLRSPVGNLLAVFNLMDRAKVTDEETLEYIDMLKSAADNLKDTLNSYVDVLSRNDVLNVPIVELNLQDCLDTELTGLKSLLNDSHAQISAYFSAFAFVNFNKAYLESIFLNLITNSVKYARPGINPEISITSQYHNGIKQLIYTDNGQGFDMDKVKHRIFGFNQKFHDRSDSKGIGLYLVHNYITSLGGHIEVQSKINEGATFVITFSN